MSQLTDTLEKGSFKDAVAASVNFVLLPLKPLINLFYLHNFYFHFDKHYFNECFFKECYFEDMPDIASFYDTY